MVRLIGDGVYGSQLRNSGLVLHVLSIGSFLSLPLALLRLQCIVKREAPDIVQAWMHHVDLVGGLEASSLDIPVYQGLRQGSLSREANKRSTLLVARTYALDASFVEWP